MRGLVIEAGAVLGELTVLETRRPPDPYIKCICSCGVEVDVHITNRQRSKSCGHTTPWRRFEKNTDRNGGQ